MTKNDTPARHDDIKIITGGFGMATKEKEREEKGLTDYGIIYLSGVIGEKVKHRYSLGKDDL